MPPEDIEIPRETPIVRTRDTCRRLVLAPDLALGAEEEDYQVRASRREGAETTVTLMDPLQYITYSGGLGECWLVEWSLFAEQ